MLDNDLLASGFSVSLEKGLKPRLPFTKSCEQSRVARGATGGTQALLMDIRSSSVL